MAIRDLILITFYAVTFVIATAEHTPQVHEDLDEDLSQYIRNPRHSDVNQKIYQPPVFNYRTAAVQQDRLKSRYYIQQQADTRNLRIAPTNPDVIFKLHQYLGQNRGNPTSIPFEETDDDWKPFQPNFLNATQSIQKQNDIVGEDIYENDLDSAGSEQKEESITSDRHDEPTRYIYVAPSILKNNFGLDSETTQQILQNSASQANTDKFQISELQELLGKNPAFQLQGLQKLLEETKPNAENNLPVSNQNEVSNIQIQHNGSPASLAQLDKLQQQIEAVNSAQEQQALAAAQAQAEAHVKAQHEAIALAQKKAQEEALAKIAAHNEGLATLTPSNQLTIQDGTSQITPTPLVAEKVIVNQKQQEGDVQEIVQNSIEQPKFETEPAQQVLVQRQTQYAIGYTQDLGNVKPRIQGVRGRFYRPVSPNEPEVKYQYLSTAAPLYGGKQVQNYSPVSPYKPQIQTQTEIYVPNVPPETTKTYPVNVPVLQEQKKDSYSYQPPHIIKSSGEAGKQLYDHQQQDDLQYAAKYAFGYRIVDQKHKNNFGHEEKRDGALTKGHYYVTLPDGRKQMVDYFADNNGYHARVHYENVARHPYVLTASNEQEDHLQTIHK